MTLRRRTLLLAAGLGGLPAWALAQAARDAAAAEAIYVEGQVNALHWADPQPHLVLTHVPRQVPKGELQARRIRPSAEPLAVRGLLDRVLVVPGGAGPWRVHLPSLARLAQWGVTAPKVGQSLGVLGAAIPRVGGMNTLSAQVLFLPDAGYPLLFDPA